MTNIEVTDFLLGCKVLVNIERVCYTLDNDGSTMFYFTGDLSGYNTLRVAEDYETVKHKIQNAKLFQQIANINRKADKVSRLAN